MKVLWVGDAVVSSGFAACTHAACGALHAAGHEVHVLGINYWGDAHNYPYTIYPCMQPLDGGRDGFGVSRLPILVERLRPDVVVLLNDPWNVPSYLSFLSKMPQTFPHPTVVGWLAVDAKNQRGTPLNDLDHVVVWTQFAADELARGGYDGACSIVPLGVDHSIFYPRPKDEARQRSCPVGFPYDAFLVGVVGRNQPRKRLDLSVAYFANWIQRNHIDNAWLYFHVAPTGDRGCDVRSLTLYHDLKGKVILSEPEIGYGVDGEKMAYVYSAFDVLLTTSQGEGWGLPVLEAMACGVPCIVPDWSGLGSWVGDAAVKVACTTTALSAPLNGLAYTIGGVIDRRGLLEELNAMYRSEIHRNTYRHRGLRLAQGLTWEKTGHAFLRVLEQVMEDQKKVQAGA